MRITEEVAMAISKKKVAAINSLCFITDALESVMPQYSDSGEHGSVWWNHQPDTWTRMERDLFDLLSEHEHKIKRAVMEILGVADGVQTK